VRKDPQNDTTNSNMASHHMKPPVWLEVKQKSGRGPANGIASSGRVWTTSTEAGAAIP